MSGMSGKVQKTKHVLATTSVNVVESSVSIVAPANVSAGEFFSAEWTGPNRENDYVDLVKKGDKKTYGELSYFYTKDGSPGQLQAPAAEGEYDLRYILEAPGGREILYTAPIKVKPTTVSLAFEPTAEVAETFTVYWTGPNNKNGYIDIVKAGYTATYGEISYFYLKDSPDNGELLAPVEAGDYQVRFVMEGADGRKVLASSPITIKSVATDLSVPPSVAAGSSVEIQWTGPNRKGDYVDLMPMGKDTLYGELTYFYTNDNPNKGTLVMPDKPGEYKVRYVLQGRKRAVLAEKAIIVN
jgi:Ca-activated chloride channel family protein